MRETDTRRTRRAVLRATGATALGALAGCFGSGEENNDKESNGEKSNGEPGPYGGWLDGANAFETVSDETGRSKITIDVGAGGGYAFAPAAVKVSPETEVVWEWTGTGGTHNVVERDGAFESELASKAGHTFSHTLQSIGVAKYVCEPHQSMGMRGVVEVVKE